MRRNFVSYKHGPIDTLDEPYDFLSIMHYDNKAFTKNGKDTLQSLKNPKMKLGQVKRLTKTDVNQINKLYRCSDRRTKGTSNEFMIYRILSIKPPQRAYFLGPFEGSGAYWSEGAYLKGRAYLFLGKIV